MAKPAVFTELQVCAQRGRSPSPALSPRAFTLLELLVVIAIIALLMSISVPALDKAKASARDLVCTSNLQQLGQIWNLYIVEHDQKFMPRGCGYSRGAVSWFHEIADYYQNQELILCPLALRTPEEGGLNPNMAWDNTTDLGVYYKGSYGINLWVADGADCSSAGPDFERLCWRTPNVRGAIYAPLLLCSQWKDVQPYPSDQPLEYESLVWTPGPYDEMRRPCIKRHAPYYVNVLFLDFSVDSRTIKQLWRLKWHREWPADASLPIWPDWMADVPDPD